MSDLLERLGGLRYRRGVALDRLGRASYPEGNVPLRYVLDQKVGLILSRRFITVAAAREAVILHEKLKREALGQSANFAEDD